MLQQISAQQTESFALGGISLRTRPENFVRCCLIKVRFLRKPVAQPFIGFNPSRRVKRL